MSEEEEEEISEVQEEHEYVPGDYWCPAGNHRTPFFLATSERSPVVKCPICGARIGRKSVPAEAIVVDPDLLSMAKGRGNPKGILEEAKRRGYLPEDWDIDKYFTVPARSADRARVEEQEQGEEPPAKTEEPREEHAEEGRKREERTPIGELFERPKGPCEVLQEVLEQFSLREEFVHAMIRRCERKSGLHPVELLQYMLTMKSGVKTQGEAAFIAEEYAEALRQEYEKAREMNVPYPSISLSITPQPNIMANPAVQRIIQRFPYGMEQWSTPQYTPSPTSPPPPPPPPASRAQGAPAYHQPQQQEGMGPIIQMFTEIIKVLRSDSGGRGEDRTIQLVNQLMQMQAQMLQTQMQMLAKELGEGLKQFGNSMAEALKQVSDTVRALAERKPAPDPELIYKTAKAEAEREYYSKLLEERKRDIEALQKQLAELQKAIMEVTQKAATAEFQSDTARLTAQALAQIANLGHRFVDVVDKRQPLKIVIEALPKYMGMAASEKREVETEAEEEALRELEELGLVEEGGEE